MFEPQPGNFAFICLMGRMFDKKVQEMKAFAVIKEDGADLTVKEVSYFRGSNPFTSIKIGEPQKIKRNELARCGNDHIIIAHRSPSTWVLWNRHGEPELRWEKEVVAEY